jgi:hypothetical protein
MINDTTPVGTVCSQTTAPFPPSSRSTPEMVAARQCRGFGGAEPRARAKPYTIAPAMRKRTP